MIENIRNIINISKDHVWYPFTQMQGFNEEELIIIEKGKGNYLIDINGKSFIDGISSLWTNVHGHNNEKLNKAIKDQVNNISHTTMLGLGNLPAIKLAKKLADISPGNLKRVFYSDAGSTAVEIALKMAFQYNYQSKNNNKNKFISLKNAYHGDTLGSVSVGGIDIFHKTFGPLLFESYKAVSPYCYRCPFDKEKDLCNLECADNLENLVKEKADELVAVIVEPLVQGAAGILVYPDEYLKRVRQICNNYNVFMIVDEVATGFGKTGTMFACERVGVSPDIMTVAKSITGGYLPLAATIVTEEIYSGFLGEYIDNKTFFHGHTYTGNPIACATALANIELFQENKVLEKIQPKIKLLQERLKKFRNLDSVGDIRQCGIMIGIELVKNKKTKEPFPLIERIGHKVILEARKEGLIIRPLGDVIVLMPPLSITDEEINKLCNITFSAIRKVSG